MTEEELKTQFLRIGNKAPERNTGESRELYRNILVTVRWKDIYIVDKRIIVHWSDNKLLHASQVISVQ
jgi:hypothetical protein